MYPHTHACTRTHTHTHTHTHIHTHMHTHTHTQSISVPLQGFLNAIVYGWTREDFVKAISGISHDQSDETTPIYRSTLRHDDRTNDPALLISGEDHEADGEAEDTDVQETEFEDD